MEKNSLDICMHDAFNLAMNRDKAANLLAAFAALAAKAASEAAAEAAGDGVPGAAALTTLRQYPGLSIHKLSQTLGLSHSATVRVVDRLQEQEHIVRHPGTDRRFVRVQLTEPGERAADRARDARLSVTKRLMNGLADDEVNHLQVLLERLLDAQAVDRVAANFICRLCDEAVCGDCPVDRAARRFAAIG